MGRLGRLRRSTSQETYPGQRVAPPSWKKEEAVKRSLVMLIAALLIPHLALAQDVKQTDPVIVTATKVETPQSHLGAAVTVITDDEVRTFNYAGVEEALRNVPGVEIARSGGLGRTTSIRIRGANPEQVVVLVDGVRISSPTRGLTELSELTLD